jgi:tRNA(His) 5'-end guanylyltransferase
MSSLRAKIIDRNRYVKNYPFVKSPKRTTYIGDEYLAIEVGSITFTNTDSGTLTFDAPFGDDAYQIVAQAVDTGADNANVVLYISSADQNSVTVKSSSPFTGRVDIIAMRLGK